MKSTRAMSLAVTFLLAAFATESQAATKAQINAAIDAVPWIKSITAVKENEIQPRCIGCRRLRVEGKVDYKEVWAEVLMTGPYDGKFSTMVIEQSK
jgi:hypothetical protein